MSNKRRQSLIYVLADIIAAILAWLLFAYQKGELWNEVGEIRPQQWLNGGVISFYWLFLYGVAGLYSKPFRRSRLQEMLQVFKFTIFGVLAFFFLVVMDEPLEDVPYSRYRINMTQYFFCQFALTSFVRLIITSRTNIKIRNRQLGFPTLIIGCQKEALNIWSMLEDMRKSLGYQFVGYICSDEAQPHPDLLKGQLSALGSLNDLPAIVKKYQIEEIIIALEKEESNRLATVIEHCERTSAYIKIVPGIYDYIVGSVKISHILGAPLIEIFPQIMSNWERVAKRLLDISISMVALTILLPVYLAIGLAILLDSKGKIFFRQERIGKEGKAFKMIKFRSMVEDAEKTGPSLSRDGDPRITRVGQFLRKSRLDELPQFWNVLKGEMSIVGPRPERQFFIDQIVEIAPHYRHLHKVRPGITSWGQVKYGYASTVPEMVERLKFDILYIENMSLSLDIKIILYTIIVIIEGRGK